MSKVSFDSNSHGKSVVIIDRSDSVSQPDYIFESNRRASRFFRRRLDDRFYIDDTRKYEEPSLSYRLYLFLYSGKRYYITEGIQAVLNTVWCILYIYETYQESLQKWNIIADYVFATILLGFFFLNLFTNQSRLKFLISFYAIIDYFTIIPSFLAVQLVPQLRHLAILRIFRVTRFTSLITNRTYKNISKIIGIIICFLFIVTSLLLIFEKELVKNFHTALYFAVITISTVGFGDLSPTTTVGRFLIILAIVTAIVLIPIQGYLLSKVLFESTDPFEKRFIPSRKRHIIITGNNIKRIKVENFIDELLLKYNTLKLEMSIIILQPTPLSKDLERLVDEYSGDLEFFQGDPTNHVDLRRVAAERARVIVLFGDSLSHGNNFDRDIIFTNLSIKSYCSSVPIFAYLSRPENEPALLSTCIKDSKEIDDEIVDKYNGIFIVPKNELQMMIIGHSLMCKGFCTLISNLLRTEFENFKDITFENESDEEYSYGVNHEFYCGPLQNFQNYPFHKAVSKIYKSHNSILVGLLLEKLVVINPYDHIIDGSELGFFIAIKSTIPETLKKETMVDQNIEPRMTRNLFKSGVNKYVIAAKNEIMSLSEKQIQESGFYRLLKEKVEFLSLHCHIVSDIPKEPPILVDAHKLKGHIIIYGYIEDYIHIIRPLRSRALKNIKPILIVTNDSFPMNEWEDISIFPEIYIMTGEFTLKYDLIRANIEDASDIIISYNYPENVMSLDHQFRETAIVYLCIKKSYPYANVIIDIEDESLLRLFYTKPLDPIFYPEVKSGCVFPRTLLDRLMAQIVYNPYLLSLIMNLSFFHATKNSEEKEVPNNNIILLELPRKLIDKTFQEVFSYFLKKKKSICIGLYRIRFNKHLMEKEEFVYTCPKGDTIVTKDDQVYLITSLKS